MPLRLRLLFSDDAGSGGGPTESDSPEPDNGDTAEDDGNESPPDGGDTAPTAPDGGDTVAPTGDGVTDGNESPPADGDTAPTAPDGGDTVAPAGDGPTGGDAAPAGTAADISLQVRGGELTIGGQFELTDAAITPAKLDAGTEAKRRALRDRIGAEAWLMPGTGITISAADDDGRRLIATDNPHSRAGGDLEADDTFRQPPLDLAHDWRLEAVQLIEPHVVRLVYNNTTQKFRSEEFRITYNGTELVTGVLEYQRAGSQTGAGNLTLTTSLKSPPGNLANLFKDMGRTVDSIILQAAAKEKDVRTAKEEEIRIQAGGSSSTLVMVSKRALTVDPGPMATATEVYARVNFGFTRSDRVTGWERDKTNDIPGDTVQGAAPLINITPGSMAVIDNGVILIANTVKLPHGDDPATSKIWAFKKNDEGRFSRYDQCDIRAVTAAQGMAYDASTSKLYVLPSSAAGVKVYKLTDPGTNLQNAAELRETVSARTLTDAYGRGDRWHRWGIALHGNDLYVGYHDGKIRCFVNGRHDRKKDIAVGAPIMGITAVGNYLVFGGPLENGITVWDLAKNEVVHDLAIVPSVLAAINPNFEIGAIAYNSTDQRLYVIDHNSDHVAAFAASNRAYPESEHRFRTMDKERLKAEVREDVAVEAVDKLPAPGTPGRRVWVKRDYPVRSVYVQPHSFNGTALQNSDLGSHGYWRRAADGWAVGSLLGVFPALHMLSNTKLALLAGQVTGPAKLHVGANHYPLVAGSKNTRLLAGHDTLVDLYTITSTGGLPAGDWNDVWIEGATQSDRAPAVYNVKQGEYADTGSAWSPAGFDAPLGNAGNDFDLLIRERIPGAEQIVTEALRTLDRRTLQDAVRGWFAPWAQAGSSADIPLGRLPIKKLTQAEYDAKVAANTVDANTVYVIVG